MTFSGPSFGSIFPKTLGLSVFPSLSFLSSLLFDVVAAAEFSLFSSCLLLLSLPSFAVAVVALLAEVAFSSVVVEVDADDEAFGSASALALLFLFSPSTVVFKEAVGGVVVELNRRAVHSVEEEDEEREAKHLIVDADDDEAEAVAEPITATVFCTNNSLTIRFSDMFPSLSTLSFFLSCGCFDVFFFALT